VLSINITVPQPKLSVARSGTSGYNAASLRKLKSFHLSLLVLVVGLVLAMITTGCGRAADHAKEVLRDGPLHRDWLPVPVRAGAVIWLAVRGGLPSIRPLFDNKCGYASLSLACLQHVFYLMGQPLTPGNMH